MLGPSGCGKTTTLRMVAGFEQPTAGRILIDGGDVAGLPAYKRPTNTVFQSYALFPHLSVGDNVAFGLRRKKVAKDEIAPRVEAELERVGLAARDQPPAQPALRRSAAARRAGARARQPPQGAAARRAARRPRPEAPQGPAARAQEHPARRRHHVRLRDARPGGGADDVRPDRGHEPTASSSRCDTPEDVYERPTHDLRRRLHRRLEPDARRRSRRPTAAAGCQARHRASRWTRGVDGLATGERCHAVVRPEKLQSSSASGRGRPCRRWPAASRASWRARSTSAPRPRSSSQLPGGVAMTVLVPERERGRARAAARRRRPRAPGLGAGAHARGPRVEPSARGADGAR